MQGESVIAMPEAKKIAAAFHQRAADYDRHIAVQKRVVENLVRDLHSHQELLPGNILDVGSGTGSLLSRLSSIWPEASLCGVDLAYNMCLRSAARLGDACLLVNGDAGRLPFRPGIFDLVVSTSALQWTADLSQALHELRRVMMPGASLSIAFFCEGTLSELHRCIREAVGTVCENSRYADRLHKFHGVGEVEEILSGMDFERVVVNCETETDWYDDLQSLLRSIRNIGAGTVSGGADGGLAWRGIIKETSQLYRDYYGENGRIPVTYKVLYLKAELAML